MVWIKFLISIIIILICGYKLSKYGDVISEKTGLGKGFIGVLLLGAITSLPEVITTISSVSLVKNINLAWGNIYGSNLLNISVIAFCDFLILDKDFRKFNKNNVLTGALGVIITVIGIIGIAIHKKWLILGHISFFSILILGTYIIGAYVLYLNERARKANSIYVNKNGEKLDKKIFIYFAINAILIVLAGVNVTYACDEIAKVTGLGSSFVGSLFLALATSLPEIVVSISAIKLGAVSMAVGNILGSNFFNVSIIGLSDLFYVSNSKSIFYDASHIHILTGLIFIILTNIYLTGMVLEAKKRFLKFGYDSIIIIFLYLATFSYIFKYG